MLKRFGMLIGVSTTFWLTQLFPPVVFISLVLRVSVIASLGYSLLLLPVVFVVFLKLLRGDNRRLRWWIVQYIGLGTVCFSAAVVGLMLSTVLDSFVAGATAVILGIVFFLWSVLAAQRVHLSTVNIATGKLTKDVQLLHWSDIHIGSRRPQFLNKLVDRANDINPDLLVITGDLLDESIDLEDLVALTRVNCPVFYCSGNHERYVDFELMLRHISHSGVKVLRDETIEFMGLVMYGIDDRETPEAAIEALQMLSRATAQSANPALGSGESLTVLLYHQPNIWETAREAGVDLMLSGHTHNGQIWPFGWLVRLRYPFLAGHYQQQGRHLFVSQGTGTWGPVMRFGTRCEMTLITLKAIPEHPDPLVGSTINIV